MCGIAGELSFIDPGIAAAHAARMLSRLDRRGPDTRRLYCGEAALAHARLAVIDLSPAADQPMIDEALGLALVFNGTIYNHRELRAECEGRGHRFASTGDSEVILKAYAEWGEACVERLHGVFAFAIWDMRARRLFLARDRLGVKPLYYSLNNARFRFASTLQAITAPGDIDAAIDPAALHHHLTLHAVVPAPATVLKAVRKLEPAHSMTVERDGRMRRRRYWSLDATRDAADEARDEGEWLARIREELVRAVRLRAEIADVPTGVLLSGGLDSSLIVGLLRESISGDLATYSIGFEDEGGEAGDEFEYSDPVAERFETKHHRIRIDNRELLGRLDEAVAHMAEPMVAQDCVAFYLLAERVSRDLKVVQSGQGADEVFGGYFWYPLMDRAQGSPLERFRPLYFDRPHEECRAAVAPALRAPRDVTSEWVAAQLAAPGAASFIDAVFRMDVTSLIVDDPVKRVDNMTMAWGLESRVPFLDHRLVEAAMKMPPQLKLEDGGKAALKRIARGLLPDAVIDRRKGYFPVPPLKHVRGEFFEFMEATLNSAACVGRGLFDRDYVARLLADPGQLTPLRGSKLWHHALLERWMQINLDAPTGASQPKEDLPWTM